MPERRRRRFVNTVASLISQEPGNSLPDSSRFGGCWVGATVKQRLLTAFASAIGCSGRITRDSDRTLMPEEEHESPEEVRSQRKRCLQSVDE